MQAQHHLRANKTRSNAFHERSVLVIDPAAGGNGVQKHSRLKLSSTKSKVQRFASQRMTTNNPFYETYDSWASPQQRTLRQDAAKRVSAKYDAETESEHYHNNAFTSPIPTRQYGQGNAVSTPRDTPDEIANSARKEWRLHGAGVTQALEEKRRQIVEDRPGAFSVRVLSAESRLDVSGAKYTA